MPRPNPLIPSGAVTVIDDILSGQRMDVCQVKRPTQERSSGGAVKTVYGVVHSYGCRKRAAGAGNESVVAGMFQPNTAYLIAFDRHADIRADDRIVIDDKTYEVVGVPDESTFGFQFTVAANLMRD